MTSILDQIEITVRSLAIADDIEKMIDEECDGMQMIDAQALRMTIAMGVVVISCRQVGAAVGRHPVTVLEKLMQEAAKMMPPMPEPPAEKPVKPRPEGYESPWGRVR